MMKTNKDRAKRNQIGKFKEKEQTNRHERKCVCVCALDI